ncbi:MAG: TlpA disulfide reductase family protein [Wenzhouxiangellaceae bacterium]|nr:TlpA disulfide reductase family protein [Wenzhouxiangellaceae bacterium]
MGLLALTSNTIAQEAAAGGAFELNDADGRAWTLPADQEALGVYLFWASWCPYCRALMPHLQSIVDEYGDAVEIYALNFRDQNDPRAYMEEQGFDFVLFPDADAVATDWGVRGTPGLFIIDSSRQVRFNLYQVLAESPPGFEDLSHTQRAQRRAPFWAARIRETLDQVLAERAE